MIRFIEFWYLVEGLEIIIPRRNALHNIGRYKYKKLTQSSIKRLFKLARKSSHIHLGETGFKIEVVLPL